MPRGSAIELEAMSLLDQAIARLRWSRAHLDERATSLALRELQLLLAAVSLMLDYEMDGEPEKARLVLERAAPKYDVPHLSGLTWDPALFDEGH